ELVAIAPRFDGGHDRLDARILEAADAAERLAHLRLLLRELALVWQHLPGRTRVRRPRLDALRAGLDQFQRARLGVCALALGHERADAVPGHGSLDEQHVAVEARHAGA